MALKKIAADLYNISDLVLIGFGAIIIFGNIY